MIEAALISHIKYRRPKKGLCLPNLHFLRSRYSLFSMSMVLSIILFLLLPYSGAKNTSDANSEQNTYKFCAETNCSLQGPNIRFPFRLKTQPIFCGLEGFELSCANNKTLLRLPSSSDYYVQEIDYFQSKITIMDVQETACTLKNLFFPNLTNSKFFTLGTSENCTILNCTERIRSLGDYISSPIGPIDCTSSNRNFVYAIDADVSVEDLPSTCTIYQTVNISIDSSLSDAIRRAFTERTMVIGWEALDGCYDCEKSGNYCGLNITSNSTICFRHKHSHDGHIVTISVSTATSIACIVLFTLVILIIYRSRKSENEKETQLKVDKFLEDYRTLNPARYTYSDLKKITGKFRLRLGQGGFGIVFRGKFYNGIPVAVKMLEHSKGNGEEFINEVATIGRIHHFNIVRLLGFCLEGSRRALIYEFMPNGSLEKFIFSKVQNSAQRPLSWEKLRNIAIGVARGVEYLHQGCNQRILHFDIKPHNILLDHNFQPKISDFGLAKLCSKEQSIVSMTAARGTAGYIAPELFSRNFGEVSYKADVFSYGMMLLEMVGCRKNIDLMIENQSQIYFPEWIYNKMSEGKELNLEIEADGDEEIAKKLAIVGLWCIQWNPTERPSMPVVIQMLESDLQSLEMPPKPFVSSDVEVGAN